MCLRCMQVSSHERWMILQKLNEAEGTSTPMTEIKSTDEVDEVPMLNVHVEFSSVS